MKIQIDGVNTMNKGAELMLVSVLEEIERTHPSALVYLNPNSVLDHSFIPKTKNTIRIRNGIKYARYAIAIMKRLHLPFTYFTHFHAMKDIDIVLDASGFQYSDQWVYSQKNLEERRRYYEKLKKYKTRSIFLPQAFGPFDTTYGKRSVKPIKELVDLVIARDKISHEFLKSMGFVNERLWKYPDFTFVTEGVFMDSYKHLHGKVCIIPNKKIVSHAAIDNSNYVQFLLKCIELFKQSGKECYLLNHEGDEDYQLCKMINERIEEPMEIVSGLTAKQVKGVIGKSLIVFSSRFHGVASSLSSGIPCLSTSWNHKYKMLYADFELEPQVLNLNEKWEMNEKRILSVLNNREKIHKHLLLMKKELTDLNRKMWEQIWSVSVP